MFTVISTCCTGDEWQQNGASDQAAEMLILKYSSSHPVTEPDTG
jgi:hypothetical protein